MSEPPPMVERWSERANYVLFDISLGRLRALSEPTHTFLHAEGLR